MTAASTNLAASVRQRLLNLATERGEEFEQILVRYALERLLYRLSKSAHAEQFVLKGALLFRLWFDLEQRPTRDADFLAFGSSEPDVLAKIFRELAAASIEPDDGLLFDSASVKAEAIRQEAGYPGVRVTLQAKLVRSRIPVQCDIGFGDVVTPTPDRKQYPTLLAMPAPILRVYPLETVVAEKIEALVVLGGFNTRLKDYFDLWVLMRFESLDAALLPTAIRATFSRRGTRLPSSMPAGLSDEFADNKQVMWQAFLRRSNLQALPLNELVSDLRNFYWPLLKAAGTAAE